MVQSRFPVGQSTMFTGIVQTLGTIQQIEKNRGGCVYIIAYPKDQLASVLQVGDSIAVNGACLTAARVGINTFTADISTETLAKTTLGDLHRGDLVNLETALTLATPLGGHLMTGHVDACATIHNITVDGNTTWLHIEMPEQLMRYCAKKGCIAIDGVSLTIAEIENNTLAFALIPHTLTHTTAKAYPAGQRVNVEVDLLARYLERLYYRGTSTPM